MGGEVPELVPQTRKVARWGFTGGRNFGITGSGFQTRGRGKAGQGKDSPLLYYAPNNTRLLNKPKKQRKWKNKLWRGRGKKISTGADYGSKKRKPCGSG